jgi:formylglycine-generating enzyme required for sulfatase activity
MSGNVYEWVNDWYLSSYYASSPAQNPPGPSSGFYRVLRGGAFFYNTSYLRASYRTYSPTFSEITMGCRAARNP